ncbi:MAG: hemolysin family protein [Melioribacteraceae bacterium]|jgi:putative hemolysin|nr:hemolysin family protein [Melioribacteraceae bacterium]
MNEIVIIGILILINGILAMSEIAFVSARKFKLEDLSQKGNKSAQKALKLLEDPERFLSAVQIGITLVGILAGAFGGYALAEDLTPYLQKVELLKEYAAEISFTLLVIVITYLSLIFGELVPKSIALKNAERITVLTAPLMYSITKVFSPLVGFLSISTKVILWLFRIKQSNEVPVTEEELKSLLELGTRHGTFEKEESEMIKKVFNFNDKKVGSILIPRTEIEWIDLNSNNREIFEFIKSHNFSRYLVCDSNIDNFHGIIESKEFLINYNENPNFEFKEVIKETLIVHESIFTIDLLEKFRASKSNLALVVDEYGGTKGLITLHDLIEDIFGELPEEFDEDETKIIVRADGSLLVDGLIDITELMDKLSLKIEEPDYSTLSGFIMHQLGTVPAEGEILDYEDYRFEVIDMDGKRIDKVLIKKTI